MPKKPKNAQGGLVEIDRAYYISIIQLVEEMRRILLEIQIKRGELANLLDSLSKSSTYIPGLKASDVINQLPKTKIIIVPKSIIVEIYRTIQASLLAFDQKSVLPEMVLSSSSKKTLSIIIARGHVSLDVTDKIAAFVKVKRKLSQAPVPPIKSKKSTERGEAKVKIIAALNLHHQYSNGSCLNWEPIGCGEIAIKVRVAKSSATEFFKKQFKSHTLYKHACMNEGPLCTALKLLNGEITPHLLYDRNPEREDQDND